MTHSNDTKTCPKRNGTLGASLLILNRIEFELVTSRHAFREAERDKAKEIDKPKETNNEAERDRQRRRERETDNDSSYELSL